MILTAPELTASCGVRGLGTASHARNDARGLAAIAHESPEPRRGRRCANIRSLLWFVLDCLRGRAAHLFNQFPDRPTAMRGPCVRAACADATFRVGASDGSSGCRGAWTPAQWRCCGAGNLQRTPRAADAALAAGDAKTGNERILRRDRAGADRRGKVAAAVERIGWGGDAAAT